MKTESITTSQNSNLDYLVKRGLFEKAKKLIAQLIIIKKNLLLYPPKHPQVVESAIELENLLSDSIFTTLKQISFNFFDEEIFFGEEPMPQESLKYNDFIATCLERFVGSITFFSGVTQTEIINFLSLLNEDAGSLKESGGINTKMNFLNIVNISVSNLKPRPDGPAATFSSGLQHRHTVVDFKVYNLAVKNLKEMLDQAESNRNINIEQTGVVVNSLIENMMRDESTLLALTAIKNHDEYTCYHSVNVAILSMFLGTRIGLDREHLFTLGAGALLHDVGKVNIPQEIINKPGPLTAAEWKIMKNHPLESVELLCGLSSLDKKALIIAFEHHLGYDLSGYPETKKKKNIHFFSRMVQIADTYDGATSSRSYHGAKLPNRVLASMFKKSGTVFDPTILKIFIQTLGLYPVGSLVELTTGEVAIVIETNKDDILRPKVKVIANSSGKNITSRMVDLSVIDKKNKDYYVSIVKAVDPTIHGIDLSSYLKTGL